MDDIVRCYRGDVVIEEMGILKRIMAVFIP